MVVIVRESPPNPLNSGLGIIVICPDKWVTGVKWGPYVLADITPLMTGFWAHLVDALSLVFCKLRVGIYMNNEPTKTLVVFFWR